MRILATVGGLTTTFMAGAYLVATLVPVRAPEPGYWPRYVPAERADPRLAFVGRRECVEDGKTVAVIETGPDGSYYLWSRGDDDGEWGESGRWKLAGDVLRLLPAGGAERSGRLVDHGRGIELEGRIFETAYALRGFECHFHDY